MRRLATITAAAVLGLALTGCITKQRANKALAHQQMAQVHFDAQDYPGAITELLESIELNPYIAESHHLLALCYQATGRLDRAHEAISTAVRLKEPFPEAYVNWGGLYIEQEDYELALEKLKVAADEPTYREAGRALHNMGWAHYNLGQYDEAQQCYEKVLGVTPLFCPSVLNLGMVHEARGELDEARRLYERASDCNKADLMAQMRLGKLCHKQGDLECARFHLDFVAAHDEGGKLGTEAQQLLRELPELP